MLLPVLLAACSTSTESPAPSSPAPAETTPTPPSPPGPAAAIAHGGVGTDPALADGCRAAVDAALAALAAGADPIDAAVAGVVVLEDDPRFNAGTGSVVRLDGRTVQMDASVMDSGGRFGAVLVIEEVKNPVRVARAVADTPHLVLAGDGATRFARTLGMEPFDPATEERRAAAQENVRRLDRRDPALPEPWQTFGWRARWNFPDPPPPPPASPGAEPPSNADTVGVVVRSADGRYAAALSTGGTSVTLDGRVGDVGILGAGLFAGPNGAVAGTGVGERIIEAGLARATHERMAAGTVQQAVDAGVERLAARGDIGLIAIGTGGFAAAASRPMAWAAREEGSTFWSGP